MSPTDTFVSVVVPLYRDSEILTPFIADLIGVLESSYSHYEVVLVDDGSTDETAERAGEILAVYDFIRFIQLSRHFGEEVAIWAGLNEAIGDFVVVMIPNTDSPQLVPTLVERSRAGMDIVYGVRTDREGQPWWYRLGAKVFHTYTRRLAMTELPQNSTQLRCLSRQAVNAIVRIKDSAQYLRVFLLYVGFKREPFTYTPEKRFKKSGGKSLRDSIGLALAIAVDSSTHPLRQLSYVAVFASLLNLLYVGYIVVVYILRRGHTAEGWATLSLQNAVQFFFVAVVLAGLCEYTGRILSRASGRPPYFIREERNSSVLLKEERRNVVEEGFRAS